MRVTWNTELALSPSSQFISSFLAGFTDLLPSREKEGQVKEEFYLEKLGFVPNMEQVSILDDVLLSL